MDGFAILSNLFREVCYLLCKEVSYDAFEPSARVPGQVASTKSFSLVDYNPKDAVSYR